MKISRIVRLVGVLALLALLGNPISANAQGTLLVGGRNQVVRFDATTGAFTDQFAVISGLESVDLNLGPNGNVYVVNSQIANQSIEELDVTTGASLGFLVPPTPNATFFPMAMTFSADGSKAYVANNRTSVEERDATTGLLLRTFTPSLFNKVPSGATVGPDGQLYVAVRNTKEVWRFDVASGTRNAIFSLPAGQGGAIDVEFDAAGNMYVSNSFLVSDFFGRVYRFNNTGPGTFGSPVEFATFASVPPGPSPNFGGKGFVDGIAFGPDDNLYALDRNNDQVVRFDGTTGAFIDVFASHAGMVITERSDILFVGGGTTGNLVIGSWDATRGPANATPNIGVIPPVMKSAILAAHPCATFVETGTLTPAFLSGVDVLLLAYLTRFTPFPSTGTPLSAAEQTALFDFVSGGGSVFLMGENIGLPSAATFFAPFGISVGGTPPNGIIVTDPFLSAATSGPHGHLTTQLAMGVGGAFTDPGPNGILIGTSGTFSTLVYVDFNAIAPGSGAVLGVNDSFPFLVGHIQPNNPGVCAWNTAVNNLIAAVDDGSCTDASVNCGIPLPPPPTTNQPPVAVCQDLPLSLDASGQATLTAVQVDGGSSDPDSDPLTLSIDKSDFTCADIGNNTVTLTVSDGQETATCTATVNVLDNTAPVPDVATLPDATGDCSVTVTAPTATDNCAGSITASTTDPTTYNTQGTFSVTWTYDDGNGNTSQQTQNVVVDDVTAPVITADFLPVAGDDDDDNEDNLFAVQCSATDNCSGSPSLTAIMQAPSLTNPSVEFKVKKDKKVKYDLKKNEVKVEGPDPQGLWAAVLSAGGVTVNDGQVLKLKTTGGDKHEFKFDKDGNLEEVKAPAAPTLVCSATDAAGNVSTETVSVALLADSDSDDDDDDQAHKLAASPGDDERLPSEFGLAQNHPNPFNPTTTITFAVPEAGEVTLAIYNMRGQLIQTLQSGVIAAGQHSVVWNGMDFRGAKVSSGVYIYQLKAKNFLATRKLVLTK